MQHRRIELPQELLADRRTGCIVCCILVSRSHDPWLRTRCKGRGTGPSRYRRLCCRLLRAAQALRRWQSWQQEQALALDRRCLTVIVMLFL